MTFLWVTSEALSPYQRVTKPPLERRVVRSQPASSVVADDDGSELAQSHEQDRSKYPANPYQKLDQAPPRRISKVGELMTSPVVTIGAEAPYSAVVELFERHTFRHVPVLNRHGRLVGILSDRDLGLGSQRTLRKAVDVPTMRVEDTMIGTVLSATEETLVREAAQVMLEENIGCLPIVGRLERVVGIVTRTDILRMVVTQAPLVSWA